MNRAIVVRPSESSPLWLRNLVFAAAILIGAGLIFTFLFSQPELPTSNQSGLSANNRDSIHAAADRVDRAITDACDEAGLSGEIAAIADGLTIARRLSLGLTGTIPSLQEIRELEKLPVDEQLDWWVSRLLADRRTHDYLAERLTRAMIGVDPGPFVLYRRRRFVDWLSDRLAENVPYDQLVRDVLMGEGLWTGSPQVNFFTSSMVEGEVDPVVLAGRTSRAFLGLRIDCLQCHDDFLGSLDLGSGPELRGGMQTDFHGLAAFFSDVTAGLAGVRDRQESADYEYALLGETDPSIIAPQLPFHAELDGGEANRRTRLARWVTHPGNRPFTRATVNRVWAILCGRPLVEPIDHIPLEGPFPPALELLADDFRDHGFDLQRLIRIIVATDAFQRASNADFVITERHESAWAVFPLRRLRPDQVSGAVIQSTSLTPIDAQAPILARLLQFGQQSDFIRRFGDPGDDEFLERGETVTQRLLMLNGKMVHERITGGLNSSVRMASLSPDLEKAVETVYLATLTRRPDADELADQLSSLADLPIGEQNTGLMDLYWTLVNSLEFSWNH